jgi:hypothetical protein
VGGGCACVVVICVSVSVMCSATRFDVHMCMQSK